MSFAATVGLSELARTHTTLDERCIDHLHRLVAAWSPLADLSFADLLLYAPCPSTPENDDRLTPEDGDPSTPERDDPSTSEDDNRFVVLAHIRATTGPTVHITDPVGREVSTSSRSWLKAAMINGSVGKGEILLPRAASLQSEMAGLQQGAAGFQPGTAGFQPGAVSHRPGAAGLRPGAAGFQSGAASLQPGMASLQSGAAGFQPGAAGLRPGATASMGDDTVMEEPTVLAALRRLVVDYVPVRCGDRPIAVLARESSPAPIRQVNALEGVYRVLFNRFTRMIADGAFPYDRVEQLGEFREPRVGDGVMVVDYAGRISYASPNATSALHRLGVVQPLPGSRLSEFGLDDTVIRRSFWRRRSTVAEFNMGSKTTVVARAFPLVADDRITGAVALLRDVSEIRRRNQLLLSKDATIREIHHRVKNNLQTVSALLRLQARRLDSAEAKAAVESSVRRVSSIAMVHEHLSLDVTAAVEFDSIVEPLARMVEEGLTAKEQPLRIQVEGTLGKINGEVAMPLAVVLTELVQNAYSHSKPTGEIVWVFFQRTDDALSMRVTDSGPGVPDGFSFDRDAGLGLTIARTFVVHDLGGRITIRAARHGTPRGAVVEVTVPYQDRF